MAIMIGEWYDRDGTLSVSLDTEWYKTGTVTWKEVRLSETGRMIQAWWEEKESPTIENARAMLHNNSIEWHGDELHYGRIDEWL
jgi:hypothetical protein